MRDVTYVIAGNPVNFVSFFNFSMFINLNCLNSSKRVTFYQKGHTWKRLNILTTGRKG